MKNIPLALNGISQKSKKYETHTHNVQDYSTKLYTYHIPYLIVFGLVNAPSYILLQYLNNEGEALNENGDKNGRNIAK